MTHPVCPDCGEPLEDNAAAEFVARSDMMADALDGIEDPSMEMILIAGAAGDFLARFPADERDAVRAMLLAEIDSETKDAVVGACDA